MIGLADAIHFNLGVDFGTTFTKVVYRDVGGEASGVVAFAGNTTDQAMIPSVVIVNGNGELRLEAHKNDQSSIAFRYLKMRLAGATFVETGSLSGTIDLGDAKGVLAPALSSWFLAEVIDRARNWVLERESARVRGREVLWSANVGVPVEHYDSPIKRVFDEVLAVAWEWVVSDSAPVSLEHLLKEYSLTRQTVDQSQTDCHSIPEISAAVQSFITSRSATPGIYVYFDVGGGTLDGVAFNYVNLNGQRRVNFYSGKVESLGIDAIASSQDPAKQNDIKTALVTGPYNPYADVLAPYASRVRKQIGHVIMVAKEIDGRDWRRGKIQDHSRPRKTIARLDPANMIPLVVFVGGGGAGSKWYQHRVLSTYSVHNLLNADIPPFELAEVPTPGDLEMNGLDGGAFRRFSIAYGLSVPFGEGPEVRLPSHFDKPPPLPLRTVPGLINYMDSKDVFD